jgi:RNA polymerase sigma-70 factor (ECF subfamily)
MRTVRAKSLHHRADEELMPLLAEHDMGAFKLLYERHSTAAYSLAFRIVGDRNRAEEVTQEAFVSLWKTGARYDPDRSSVRSWLLAIVRNRSIDFLRREAVQRVDPRRDPEDVLADVPAAQRTESEAATRESTRELLGALGSLPDDQAAVVKLAYYGGFSHTEIADMLDAPLGTVKGRMRLGLEKMRTHLVEDTG